MVVEGARGDDVREVTWNVGGEEEEEEALFIQAIAMREVGLAVLGLRV